MASKLLDWFRQSRDRLVAAVQKLIAGPTVPFVAVYETSVGYQLPADFDLSGYGGLALCHLVGGGAGAANGQLVIYWNSESHFNMNRTRLEGDVHLTPALVTGALAEFKLPKQRWWQRLSVKDWMLTAAAVLGALTVLRTNGAYLFEEPQVQMVFSDLTPLRVSGTDPVSASLDVQNDSMYTLAKVSEIRGVATLENSKDTVPLKPDQGILPPLAVEGEKKFFVRCAAPQRHSDNGPPEKYDMVVSGNASAGILRRPRAVASAAPLVMEVWPAGVGWGEPAITDGGGMNGKTNKAAQVVIWLYPGKAYPNGVTGEIPVVSKPDEISHIDAADGKETLPPQKSSDSETQAVLILTKPLEKFKPYGLIFTLSAAKPIEEARWKDIVQSIKIAMNN